MPETKNKGSSGGNLGTTTGKGGPSVFGSNTKILQHTGGLKGVIHKAAGTGKTPSGNKGNVVK